jgi:hypothetical protein
MSGSPVPLPPLNLNGGHAAQEAAVNPIASYRSPFVVGRGSSATAAGADAAGGGGAPGVPSWVWPAGLAILALAAIRSWSR